MAPPTPASGMSSGPAQDVSGVVTGAIVRYVRHVGGEIAVEALLHQIGMSGAGAKVLEDNATWISADETATLFHEATVVTGDAHAGRAIGEYHMRPHEETGIADLLAGLGSPGEVLRNISRAASKYTTYCDMDALEVGDAHAIIRVRAREGHDRLLQMCLFTQGVLAQAPVLFGLVPAVVTESECQARGGRFCLYSVAWEQRQWSSFIDEGTSLFSMAWEEDKVSESQAELHLDPETQIAQLTEQVGALSGRLEAVYSTAADLLQTDEVDAILRRITQRAAHGVNAPRFLLAVRTSPDSDFQVLHLGFTDTERDRLAAEVIDGRADDHGGSRLIVDVGSGRRHYGWLVAANPEGMRFFEQDRRTLTLYAGYAATALDVATALDDARKSDATARALLAFGTALATTRTQAEVAEHLALTVPIVLGADTSVVFLWDHERETYVESTRWVPEGNPGLAGPLDRAVYDPQHTPSHIHLGENESSKVISADHGPAAAALLAPWGLSSAIVAALDASDRRLGLVTAGFAPGRESGARVDQDMRERLTGLSSQAVTALLNANLLEQISHMAWHDALTGLPNRRLFEDRVHQELVRSQRTGEPLTLFYVDLDRFKQVNDTLGHHAGDELICQVAGRLTESVRGQDTVARLGGDEFAVLLPGLADPAVTERLARRILDSLQRPLAIAGTEVHTSGSIGIACSAGTPGMDYDDLVRHADLAMYQSKSLGRNTFQVYTDDLAGATDQRWQLAEELPTALREGKLHVLYQAQIDMRTMEVTGVEALVRWSHPDLGELLPEVFLPAAEESEGMEALDAWVLDTACHQVSEWDAEGLPELKVAVNLSAASLLRPDIVAVVHNALSCAGLSPARLELEISERAMEKASDRLLPAVDALRASGVRVAIDDVGTAMVPLDNVQPYQIDTVKIDTQIVQDLDAPAPKAPSSARSIAKLARGLGAEMVGEGVETSGQSNGLQKVGCDVAQGFFFSPPVPPEEIVRMIRAANLHETV